MDRTMLFCKPPVRRRLGSVASVARVNLSVSWPCRGRKVTRVLLDATASEGRRIRDDERLPSPSALIDISIATRKNRKLSVVCLQSADC
jgi:hypothetical protein